VKIRIEKIAIPLYCRELNRYFPIHIFHHAMPHSRYLLPLNRHLELIINFMAHAMVESVPFS
jgi:hypothetical protein